MWVDILATSVEARKDAGKSWGVDIKEDYALYEDNCEIVNGKCARKMFLTAIDEKWLDMSKKRFARPLKTSSNSCPVTSYYLLFQCRLLFLVLRLSAI